MGSATEAVTTGHTESFSYDTRFGLPTRYTDANNRITRIAYDVLDRLRTATATLTGHPAGRTLSMSYDNLGNLKSKRVR